MTLKHINITEINLKLNMQDKNVGFYLDFSIEYAGTDHLPVPHILAFALPPTVEQATQSPRRYE